MIRFAFLLLLAVPAYGQNYYRDRDPVPELTNTNEIDLGHQDFDFNSPSVIWAIGGGSADSIEADVPHCLIPEEGGFFKRGFNIFGVGAGAKLVMDPECMARVEAQREEEMLLRRAALLIEAGAKDQAIVLLGGEPTNELALCEERLERAEAECAK